MRRLKLNIEIEIGVAIELPWDLDRTAALLSRLGGRGYQVGEERASYGSPQDDFDPDSDSDFDLEKRRSQPEGAGDSQWLAPDPWRLGGSGNDRSEV